MPSRRHAPARGAPAPRLPFLLLGERVSAGVSDLPPPPPLAAAAAAAPGRAGCGSTRGAHGRCAELLRTRVGPAGGHSSIPRRREQRRTPAAPPRTAPGSLRCAGARCGGGGCGGEAPSLAFFFSSFSSLLDARGGERSRVGASASRLPQASSLAIHSCTRGRRRPPGLSLSGGAKGVPGGFPLRWLLQHQKGNQVKLCRNSLVAFP